MSIKKVLTYISSYSINLVLALSLFTSALIVEENK